MTSQPGESEKPALRSMTTGDIDGVMSIVAHTTNAPQWPRKVYESLLSPGATPARMALVAEVCGVVAGFAIASIVGGEAELESIAVAVQRQGIASALLIRLVADLRAVKVRCIRLEVRESNAPARNLYAAAAFQQTGRRRAYYHDPTEDAVLLELRIC